MRKASKKAKFDIHEAIAVLRRVIPNFREPHVTQEAKRRDPFRVLISCIISLRTKDDVTAASSRRLFAKARTPKSMAALEEAEIAKLIYPAGFYRQKAKQIRQICRDLLDKHDGNVPDEIDTLLELHGVGRKTANLVVTMGFQKPGICVDVHVHRISNRWGYVNTPTPDKTEMALRNKLPAKYWLEINDLLVTYGQNICTPVSPKCSLCELSQMCPQKNVDRTR